MDNTRWHSIDIGCRIFADKKSWNGLRFSRHYCTTHNVTLGHQEDEGTSHSGWQLNWYGGDYSPYPNLRNTKHGRYTGTWAYYKQRRPMLSLIEEFLGQSNLTSEQREGLTIFKDWLEKEQSASVPSV